MSTPLETYLSKFTGAEWLAAVEAMLPCIHEVDKNAVQIWFRFFPVDLHKFVAAADDVVSAIISVIVEGDNVVG